MGNGNKGGVVISECACMLAEDLLTWARGYCSDVRDCEWQ